MTRLESYTAPAAAHKYPLPIRTLHWIMALLMIGLLAMGIYMADIPLESPDKFYLYDWHRALGVLAFALVMVRIFARWRMQSSVPAIPVTIPVHERLAAKSAQIFFYAAMISIPVLGYIASSALPEFPGIPPLTSIRFFGAELPLVPVEKNYEITKFFITIHKYLGYAVIAVLFAHIGGALKHRYFDRPENDVLSKML